MIEPLQQGPIELPVLGKPRNDLWAELHVVTCQHHPRFCRAEAEWIDGLTLHGLSSLVYQNVGEVPLFQSYRTQELGCSQGCDNNIHIFNILQVWVAKVPSVVEDAVLLDCRVDRLDPAVFEVDPQHL